NLLGATLGVAAARSPLPFNLAMTTILRETLSDLGVRSKDQTLEAYDEVRDVFWTKEIYPTVKAVKKRDFTYRGLISPLLIPNTRVCYNTPNKVPLPVPEKLSNGKSVHDYYEVRGTMTRKFEKGLKNVGVITQNKILS